MQGSNVNFVINEYYCEDYIETIENEVKDGVYYVLNSKEKLKFVFGVGKEDVAYFRKNNINLMKINVLYYQKLLEPFGYNENIKSINISLFYQGRINYDINETVGCNYSFIDDSGKENSFELYYPNILTPVNIVGDYNLVLKKIFDDKIPEGTLIEVSSSSMMSNRMRSINSNFSNSIELEKSFNHGSLKNSSDLNRNENNNENVEIFDINDNKSGLNSNSNSIDKETSKNNSDLYYSNESSKLTTYGKFGLYDYNIYSYLAFNRNKNNSKIIIFSEDEFNNIVTKENAKYSLFNDERVKLLKNKKLKFAIIPVGQFGHWSTIVLDINNKNIYLFDSSLDHCEINKDKVYNALEKDGDFIIFGNLAKDIKLLNQYEIQSRMSGSCGFWTMITSSEFDKFDKVSDFIKDNKLKSNVLLDISYKISNIIDIKRKDKVFDSNKKIINSAKSCCVKLDVLEKQINNNYLKEKVKMEKENIIDILDVKEDILENEIINRFMDNKINLHILEEKLIIPYKENKK